MYSMCWRLSEGLAFCYRLADAFLGPRQHCSRATAEVHQFFDHG